MKKIVCMLLAFMMALSLCACKGLGKADSSSNELVGTYSLVSVNDESFEDLDADTKALMAELGDTKMTVYEDGTAQFILFGEVENLTYNDKTFSDSEGSPMDYTMKDGVLTLTDTETTIVLRKSSNDTTPPVAVDVEEAEDVEEYVSDEPMDTVYEATETLAYETQEMVLGDYNVKVVGAEMFKDIDDNEAVRFYYDFTNMSKNPTTAWLALDLSAAEDGYKLTTTYADFEDDVPEYGNDYLRVEPGVTIRCISEFSFKSDGEELTFVASEYNSGDELRVAFDPKNLPGRPTDELELELIEDPQMYLEYPAEGETEDAYVAITGAEIIEGDEFFIDGDVIRVFVDYTNNSESAGYIGSAVSVYVFQDGVQLDEGYAEEPVDSDGSWYEEVAPGDSASLSNCWTLRTESPVEVVVIDWWTEDVVCAGTFYPATIGYEAAA